MAPVNSWAEADSALAELGRLDRAIQAVEAERQEALAQAEAQAEASLLRLRERHQEVADLLERFCRSQASLAANGCGLRSRALLFGRVGFRRSEAVQLENEEKAVRLLGSWPGGQRFLRLRVEVNREALHEHLVQSKREPNRERRSERRRLARTGVRLEERDHWYYEVDELALSCWG